MSHFSGLNSLRQGALFTGTMVRQGNTFLSRRNLTDTLFVPIVQMISLGGTVTAVQLSSAHPVLGTDT